MGSAQVAVAGETTAAIGPGLLVLVGVERGDTAADVADVAHRIATMRVFDAAAGGPVDVGANGGEVLVVSQFTLLGDLRRGRRPDFARAAGRDEARPAVDAVVAALRARGLRVATGAFGEDMKVASVNDGPYTILLESRAAPRAGAGGPGAGDASPAGVRVRRRRTSGSR